MVLLDLAIFYLLVGVGACALVARRGRRRPADLLLTLALWPLIAPVALSQADDAASKEAGFAELEALRGALREVSDPRLRAALPTGEQLGPIEARLIELRGKLRELDRVLARGEFEQPAEPELRASLARLGALRDEAQREQRELLSLCRRLGAQITVLRFSGAAGDVGGLVAELMGRVEGAQAALDP